ncbi:MAG: hypothetical protein IJ745_01225 [Bacteroidales bacterium]|nr:hypothetical protein [Bacteroidales bacterium]
MKNSVKELTEGMQRLCATANRIVAQGGNVSAIERDLLMEDLRRLYDVALRMGDEPAKASGKGEVAERSEAKESSPVMDEEILSSTVMATMAAMAPADILVAAQQPAIQPEPAVAEPETVVVEPEPVVVEPEPVAAEPEPVAIEPEEQPTMEELESNGNNLLFDEVIIEEVAPAAAEEPSPTPAEEPATTPIEEPAPIEEAASAEAPIEEPAHNEGKVGTQASLLDYLKRPLEEKPTVRTLGDSLGMQTAVATQHTAAGQLSKKVSDLRTVININDKFSFMSELFHNNMKAYNDFILRLNAIDTRDEALMYVNEVSTQYKWDEASLAVQSFYKVFDKKF